MIVTSDCGVGIPRTVLYTSVVQEFAQSLVEKRSGPLLILDHRYVHIADPGCLESSRSMEHPPVAGETRTDPMRTL
jgi:hypothetical protein